MRRIGYWGTGAAGELPDPSKVAGAHWDEHEREDVEDFLSRGFVSRAYLGVAHCRICGQAVGSLELSDGVYSWPEGLLHYVREHAVSLPRVFIDHVRAAGANLMEADVDDAWWTGVMQDQSGG